MHHHAYLYLFCATDCLTFKYSNSYKNVRLQPNSVVFFNFYLTFFFLLFSSILFLFYSILFRLFGSLAPLVPVLGLLFLLKISSVCDELVVARSSYQLTSLVPCRHSTGIKILRLRGQGFGLLQEIQMEMSIIRILVLDAPKH